MIVYDFEQGSDEWRILRGQQATASNVHKAIKQDGTLSKQSDLYIRSLLAKQVALGAIDEGFKSSAMERGTEMEEEARLRFELITGLDVHQVGFCVREDGVAACSPDGLIKTGDKYTSGLEIKCPIATTQIEWLMANKVPTGHVAQVQCLMWVCDLPDAWFMSYHPVLPFLLIRVQRDEEYIAKMARGLTVFKRAMEEERVKLDRRIGEING